MKSLLGQSRVDYGIVANINRKGALIVLDRGCMEKDSCAGCKACGVSDRPPPQIFVPLSGSQPVAAGQRIPVRRFVLNEAVAAVVAFGIPVVCALLTAIWWRLHFAADDRGALASLAALGAGFILVAAADKLIRLAAPPRIAEVSEPAGGMPAS